MVSLFYVDTSAAIKLLAEERHSKAFAAFYDAESSASWVSSTLLRIEVMRAVTRVLPAALPEARELLTVFGYVSLDDDIVEAAMNEPDKMLRSLDAIHLTTARVLRDDLTAFVTYDDRLAAAASDAGIAVVSPRD
ncbi:PIN domain-containing protein [Pseudonocardiaceae bacterium YIM PH 21723]|nr:PIN domain-containing protein [Pseudonocardiaceae bacterium YIM PH 21723]